MTRQDLFIKISEFMLSDLELMKKKNADYSSEDDALSNLKEYGFMGVAYKIGDKYCRFKNWVKNGKYEVSDEGILDTLRDLGNFCYLARVMLEEKDKSSPHMNLATYCKKERT